MREGWKQVWTDIRQALGAPVAEAPEPQRTQEPEYESAGAQENAEELSRPTRRRRGLGLLAVVLASVTTFFLLRRSAVWEQPRPPAPNVVATYNGGQITTEDLQQHLALLIPEARQQGQLQHVQDYRLLVEEMLTDALVRRWASTRKAGRDMNVQHVMKHITEEFNLDALHGQLHKEQMGVTESDIQAYYEANRQQFGDQTLSEVREQIRATLQAQRESRFVEDYVKRLKEQATITRNVALLEVPEPTAGELRTYYESHREQYVIPAWAVVDEIRIAIGQDETVAQTRAAEALARLRSGAEFATVAGAFAERPTPEQGTLVRSGQRDPAYEDVVFSLDAGQTSDVFRAGDAFYIVRLRSTEPQRQQSLNKVQAQVRQAVLAEKTAAWFQERADHTLFTIRGKRYTVGEFWREYQELPAAFLARYQGADGRKALAERLIERLLLVEDSYDRLLDVQKEDQLEEARLKVLAQVMEQEEVDDKIEVTDEEVRAYYAEHKAELMEPPQARIRAIIIRLGQTADEQKRAWDKANDAYKKLVPGLLKTGADFAEVARQYSEDEATASQGGELQGWIRESPDLLAELAEHPLHERILGLGEGEISRPFAWGGAIYIVQVRERKEPRPLTFEEAKDVLREQLRLQKHDELVAELSRRLQEQANVTIYEQTLQALVEAQNQSQQP